LKFVFDEGYHNKQNYRDQNDNDGMINDGNDATSARLKSTGKSAKKRRLGVVVDGEEAENEDDEEDDKILDPAAATVSSSASGSINTFIPSLNCKYRTTRCRLKSRRNCLMQPTSRE